jgi:hypothetical protein
MMIAQPRQVIGIIVRSIIIEMGKLLANGLAAKAATGRDGAGAGASGLRYARERW